VEMSFLHSMMWLISIGQTLRVLIDKLNITLVLVSMMSIWVLKVFQEQWHRSKVYNLRELRIMVFRSLRSLLILKVNRIGSIIGSWEKKQCCLALDITIQLYKIKRAKMLWGLNNWGTLISPKEDSSKKY
jgi:hypothetical protein